jgi:hypothetical protein
VRAGLAPPGRLKELPGKNTSAAAQNNSGEELWFFGISTLGILYKTVEE